MPNENQVPTCSECVFFDEFLSTCNSLCPEPEKPTASTVYSSRIMCREFVDRAEFLAEEGLLDDDDEDEEENGGADA